MTMNEMMRVDLTENEEISMMNTYTVLMDLADNHNENAVLMSPVTGEIIQISELTRVAGVINGLLCNSIWEIKRK